MTIVGLDSPRRSHSRRSHSRGGHFREGGSDNRTVRVLSLGLSGSGNVRVRGSDFHERPLRRVGHTFHRYTGDSSPYLDHYLQEVDASAETATIWVKVPSIAASSTESIWLYYGDGTNAKTSSGIGTFPYGFYDFEEFTDGQDIIANDAAFTAANDSWYGDTTPTFTAYNSYAKQGVSVHSLRRTC